MATNITSATFSNTYKDDFLDSDGYHRILFNSGRTLQARELTQMQTILQKQIERMGNNLYKEGGVVAEGNFNANPGYEFIKLNTTSNSLPGTPSSLVGTSFTGATSGVVAKVLEVVTASGSDPATLYVQYTSTVNSPDATTSTIRMQAGENISNGSTTLTVQSTNTVANPAVGAGFRFSIGEGIYYSKGFFIFTENQSKIVSKYSDAPTADIGFKIIEDVVTTADDTGLFDNQGATPNISAPGADRFRIRLSLALRSELAADENFIHTHTVEDGQIAAVVQAEDSYNIPNDLISKRIKENSGDYFVKPFTIKFELDSASSDKLALKVSDGIAVVDGYRAAKYVPTNIRVDRISETTTVNNDVVASNFGNFVLVSPTTGANTKGLPNINTLELMNLRSAVNHGGSTIGTARVRAVTEDGNNYKFHLFDIKMNSGQAFRDVKSIGTSATNYFNPILENSKAVLKETNKNTLLFETSKPRPQTLTDISLAVQRRFTVNSNGSGQGTIAVSAAGETFTNTGDWIAAKADSDVISGISATGAGAQSSTISGLPASTNGIEVLAYVNKAAGSIRTKTLTSRSINATMDSDGAGLKFLPLGKADIFDVQTIVNSADSNQNFENRFTLDDGQRDNFYALGRMVLKGGSSAPGGTVHVKYRHFTHGSTGDFFAVNSYSGQVAYNQIPKHRTSAGIEVPLRNVLDFRPVQDSDGAFATASTGARISELPQPGTLVSADTTYFLAGAARLVIDKNGVINYVVGSNGFNPRLPDQPEETLGLYNIILGGNTLSDSDVVIEKVEAKRFTMADIARLEDRVDKVEELASLSLLELATTNFEVLDSAGTNRTKSGVVVDNFTTQTLSDTTAADYRASIDPFNQELRPAFTEDNIRFIYDSAASVNTILKGDNVYMAHNESICINQNLASRSIQINPFSVVVHEGVIVLSPTSDEWRDVKYTTAKVVDGGVKLNTKQALLWNNWQWNWGGTPIQDLKVGSTTNSKVTSAGNITTTTVNKVVSDETVRTEIGDRVIDVALLPFIRSRKIFFKAEGLRPNTRHFAFFDNQPVANFVKSETFARYAASSVDFGNKHRLAASHPEGSSTLQSDANGKIEGSFFIPSSPSTRFRTGTREFKLLDISVDNEDNAKSLARGIYAATGFLDTRQKEYISTRVLSVEGTETSVRNYYGGNDDGDGGSTGRPHYQVGNSGTFKSTGTSFGSKSTASIFT